MSREENFKQYARRLKGISDFLNDDIEVGAELAIQLMQLCHGNVKVVGRLCSMIVEACQWMPDDIWDVTAEDDDEA